MVIGSGSTQQTSIPNTLNFKSTISSSTLESFEQELASAIDGYLQNSGNGNQIEITVQPGAESGSLSIDVTANNPAAPSTTTTTAPAVSSDAAAASTASSPPSTAASVAASTSATTSSSSATSSGSSDTSEMTPTDAYWAEQPAAVQALRYAPEDEKAQMAQQLASEGYTIDVPVMVWGWDPLATMIQRQEEGYTWVPSALQANVQEAPGVSMPGGTPYSASNPPAGSIQVSTAFANGTNIAADPVAELWLQGESTSSGVTSSVS